MNPTTMTQRHHAIIMQHEQPQHPGLVERVLRAATEGVWNDTTVNLHMRMVHKIFAAWKENTRSEGPMLSLEWIPVEPLGSIRVEAFLKSVRDVCAPYKDASGPNHAWVAMQRLFLNHHRFLATPGSSEQHPAFDTYTYLQHQAEDARTGMCAATVAKYQKKDDREQDNWLTPEIMRLTWTRSKHFVENRLMWLACFLWQRRRMEMLHIMVVKPAPAYDEPGVEAGYTWEHLGSDGSYITERITELDTAKSYLVLPGEFPDCSPGYVQFGDFKTSKKYGPHRNPLVWNIEDAPYACMFEHMKDVLPADATDIAELCAVLTGERKEKQREVGYLFTAARHEPYTCLSNWNLAIRSLFYVGQPGVSTKQRRSLSPSLIRKYITTCAKTAEDKALMAQLQNHTQRTAAIIYDKPQESAQQPV